jgi:putative transposase
VKYEEVYLRACAAVSKARVSIGRYLNFYNAEAAFEPWCPDPGQAFFDNLPLAMAA